MHEQAIRCIVKYPTRTSIYVDIPYGNLELYTRGVFYMINEERGIECYVNDEFAGGWAQPDSDHIEDDMLHMV